MPPKQRFNSQDIIEAAYRVVRKHGWDGFSARTIANELKSSTRPIYDYFDSMENIEAEVVKKALAYFVEYINRDRTGDKWLDQALGYVLFAGEEKHLFRCINDEKHTPLQKQYARCHWMELGEKLSEDERFQDMPDEIKNKIRVARWILLHGLASLVCNGWFERLSSANSTFAEGIDMELVDFLKKVNEGLYKEFKKTG